MKPPPFRRRPQASSTPRIMPDSRSTSLPFTTLRQSDETQRPFTMVTAQTTFRPTRPTFRPTSRPTFRTTFRPISIIKTTKRPSLMSMTMSLDPTRQQSKLPVSSLLTAQQNTISNRSAVPRVSYTKSLFREFMSRLTSRGLLRRVPFRHIKIVFFNLLTAIGASTDERSNKQLLTQYLEHFNRSKVDNERRFSLDDMDFKDTSELLDQLIFNHLSDSFAGASNEFPRPKFTTRPTPSWVKVA